METCLIALSKTGDILSCLALAQSLSDNTHVIVSKQYASVTEGVPGITPHIFDGEWDDLRGAVAFAKKNFRRVIVPQTYGKDFPVKHRLPSFQLDQADRCGLLDKFPQIRLNMPGKSVAKESTILVADHSESSPFEQRDDLWKRLNERYGSLYKLIRLSDVQLPRFTDFTQYYAKASAIIAIDSAHLHLTSATDTPVMALTTDRPQRWHGSAYHPRFRFHCRYADYEARRDELFHALDSALAGKTTPELNLVEVGPKFSYNPSIIEWDGKLIRTCRHHPDPTHWRTQLYLNDGTGASLIAPPAGFEGHSLEDCRLFLFNGKLHISYVVSQAPQNVFQCVMQYGELVNDNGWKIVNHKQPKYGNNDFTGLQKNWVFFSVNHQLYCIYQCSPEHIVLQLDGDKVVKEYKTKSPECSFGIPRGGTQPLPHKGLFLRFVHMQSGDRSRYYLGALLMETTPPFSITTVSKHPVMAGNERYFHGWKFWKPNVQIPYGAVPHDGGWRVLCGVNDSACAEVIVKPENLNL